MIVAKLRQRRDLIGDFHMNGMFSFQSLPFEEVERGMRFFAKEVGPEVKRWQRQTPQPVDVATAAATRVMK
ncbi:MAG: hypothetical protein HYZ50_03770 [Deltaproteobacteria bacterium]|nr:hypothetical protein [Deltaproteobacteria bacterium]